MSNESGGTAITAITAISGTTAISGNTAISGSTAITAISGILPVAGSYDGATAQAMLLARDGIVGQWDGATLNPNPRTVNDPHNLEHWSLTIRNIVIMNDLLSRIQYGATAGQDRANMSIYHSSPESSVDAADDSFRSIQRRLISFQKPTPDVFCSQLDLLRSYADLRQDRLAEILTQAANPAQFLLTIAGVAPGQKRFTHELINITQGFATNVVLCVKHALACQRPDTYSPQVQPIIPTPGHGTLPSGHATETFAIATVLGILATQVSNGANTDGVVNQLMRQASRVAINRTVGGVHFPVDSIAGATLGLLLGHYLTCRAGNAATVFPTRFDGGCAGATDFEPHLYQINRSPGHQSDPLQKPPAQGDIVSVAEHPIQLGEGTRSLPLAWLWEKARGEWY